MGEGIVLFFVKKVHFTLEGCVVVIFPGSFRCFHGSREDRLDVKCGLELERCCDLLERWTSKRGSWRDVKSITNVQFSNCTSPVLRFSGEHVL